jgi:plastocyanin
MKRSVLVVISILTVFGITRSAWSQTIDDSARRERRAVATVSFGLWETEPPLDRLVADPAGGAAGNHHEMIPNIATIRIKPGDDGGVNFVVSGGHVVAVYDDGTQPGDIDPNSIEPNCPAGPITSPCSPVNAAGEPTAGGILSDPDKRIYRGPTFTGRRDGVEVVHFSKPGTYLVICARKNHFVNDGMFGFVRVLPEL